MPFWSDLTQKHFRDISKNTRVAVLVTGALEAHGHHLPLGTDTILPWSLAKGIAEKTRALVLPPIPFGDSWVFNQFAGTISVKPSSLVDLYISIMKGVFKQRFTYLVVLNGHGGNSAHIETAAKAATKRGERVVIIVNWWRDLAGDVREEILETPMGHAAEDETSEVMHISPNLVDMDSVIARRNVQKFRIISAHYRADLYQDAVYGDPAKARPEKGKAIMEQAESELIELIEELERGKLPFSSIT